MYLYLTTEKKSIFLCKSCIIQTFLSLTHLLKSTYDTCLFDFALLFLLKHLDPFMAELITLAQAKHDRACGMEWGLWRHYGCGGRVFWLIFIQKHSPQPSV